MDSDLELKYNFLPNRQNPSEVFETMAKYVKGYNDLGNLLAEAIGQKDDFSFQMVGVKEGSIIGKFAAAKERMQSIVANAILSSGVKLSEELLNKSETTSPEDVENLARTLESQLANSLTSFAMIGPHIDRKKFAEVLQSFSSANENVADGETLNISSSFEGSRVVSMINTKWRFNGDPKEMFAGFVQPFRGELKLRVKVQVNQGSQVWTFTALKNDVTFSAKILDEQWLMDYQNVNIPPISPKDTITADVEYDIYESNSGKEIKHAKIIKIVRIDRYEAGQSGFANF